MKGLWLLLFLAVLLSGCTLLAADFNGYYGQLNALEDKYYFEDDIVPAEPEDLRPFIADLQQFKSDLSGQDAREARAMALLVDVKLAYADQEINRVESTEAISALGDAPACDSAFQAGQRQFNQALADAESAFNKVKLFNSTYADFKETVTTQEGFDLEEALEARYDTLKEVSDVLAALCS